MTSIPPTKQFRAVLAVELAVVGLAFLLAFLFWNHLCSDTLDSCLASAPGPKVLTFLLLSAVRPFVFTPLIFVAIIGGKAFGPWLGALLTTVGSLLSCLSVFGLSKMLGKRYTKPWLSANLPATFKFIRSQDYKLVFAARLVPFFPFDPLSFLFGALDFRLKSVVLATLIGSLPEAFLFAKLVDPTQTLVSSTLTTLVIIGVCVIVPLLAFEFVSRKKGSGMWQLLKAVMNEIRYEVHVNNDIIKRQSFDPEKTPVLLLYGFFSSRRAVTVLERLLTARGHQVLSFNLGGLLGTFFTRDILETASFIDYKIKRQFERHGYKKIHIVAHSKGGLVALWWAVKLGGGTVCDKIVTLGTPFGGSPLSYLGLLTPLGLIWRDIGQMRPGSGLLRELAASPLPEHLTVYCIHSTRDRITAGERGLFRPRDGRGVVSIPMDHISHFEMLYRREVADKVSALLNDEGGEEATAACQ